MSDIQQSDHWLTFGTNSTIRTRDYNVWISGSESYTTPSRDLTYIDIPGRSGSFVLDNGKWKDVELTYPCFISSEFHTRFAAFVSAMMPFAGTYQMLKDNLTYGVNGYFRMAVFDGKIEPDVTGAYNTSGTFDLTFRCQPQKWLVSGNTETRYSQDSGITNPTDYDARPIIGVRYPGTVEIAGYPITISSDSPFNDYVYINSETQDCYCNGQNANMYVTLPNGFPVLKPGGNTIDLGDDEIPVVITPRWYIL